MSLPQGFMPRACQFCGSRSATTAPAEENFFRVICDFCEGAGPPAPDTDGAWLGWNGLVKRAPAVECGIDFGGMMVGKKVSSNG